MINKQLTSKQIEFVSKRVKEIREEIGQWHWTEEEDVSGNKLRKALHDVDLEIYRLTFYEQNPSREDVISLKVSDDWAPNFPGDEIIAILQKPWKLKNGDFYGSWRVYFTGADDRDLGVSFEQESDARAFWDAICDGMDYQMFEQVGQNFNGEIA